MPFDLDARLAEWRKSLLDTTKRNRLIKFVAGRVGGVNLLHPPARDLWAKLVREGATLTFPWKRAILGLSPELLDVESLAADYDPNRGTTAPAASEFERELTDLCLRSPHLQPNHLLTEFGDRPLTARLTHLFRTAKEAETDHGVTTLFAAFGFLRWFESTDSEEELLSPLLLVPVRLDRETVESPFTLRAEEDDILPNHCLAELLRTQFRIKLPTAEEAPLDPDNPECLQKYLAAVGEKVKEVARWGVVESAALGVFNFQKLAMWEDLGRNAGRLKDHPLCRAIAGDSAVSLAPPADLPAAEELDRMVPPQATTHILDADSSQHEAIEAVKRGAHLVMDGPPGTGKSQTIANMIAEALAAGKTVLFVSEKTAALDVVKRRLDKCGLGDFCLELHSHKANKKAVLAELGRCLELTPGGMPDTAERLRELGETRQKLNEFVAELHAVRMPLGWSAFRVHGQLARLDRTPGRSRVPIPEVFAKDAEYVRRAGEILTGLGDCRAVLEGSGGHPWRGCKITTYTHGAADEAKFNLTRLANAMPAAESAVAALAECGVCESPFTPRSWQAADADASRLLTLPMFPAEWFRSDPRTAAEAVVALDAASRTARELVGRLPEYDPAAVRAVTTPDAVNWNPDRERLTTALSARDRLAALERVAVNLRKLREQARAADAAARDILSHLRVPSLPFAQVGELPGVAGRLASNPPVPRSWWDAGKRGELIAAVGRAIEDERAAQSDRTSLIRKLLPVALQPQSSALARQTGEAAGSMWYWLPWSRWAKVREQVRPWYLVKPTSGREMRADMAALALYHRRVDAVQQVATAYAADLLSASNRKPDWDTTAVALKDVERLGQWKAAPDLKKLAGPGGSLDRKALGTLAGALAESTGTFATAWPALLREFAVSDPAGLLARPAAEVVAWFGTELGAVETEAAALGRMVAFLMPGKDVAAADLRTRAADLRLLVEARTSIASAAAVLCEPRSPEVLETTDHAAPAEVAQTLLAFLKERQRPVTLSPASRTSSDSATSPPQGGEVLGGRTSCDALKVAPPHPPLPLEGERSPRREASAAGEGVLNSSAVGSQLAATLTDPVARERLKVAVVRSASARAEFDKGWQLIATELFDATAPVSTSLVLEDTSLAELGRWATARAADTGRLAEWAQFVQVARDAAAFGITAVLDEVKAGEFAASSAADAFRVRFYRLWLDELHKRVPTLATFTGDTHERLTTRFAQLDRLAIRSTPDRVRRELIAKPTRPRNRDGAPEASELGILLREVNKKRRHLPLRHLFRQIPSLLPRLKPCLMMSPLAVSTYLDTPELRFDLVIFDEASQVRPHDAVCAIYRGRQLVVGGDPKQLPPTDFFNRSGEDAAAADEATTGVESFESLLDVCLSLGITRKRLRWHYRSRREGLIAFSNCHFYNGRLVTFPSADEATSPAVSFVKVPDGRFKDGVNVIEARQVAALVMEHARTQHDRSLGVIAFSLRQQERILDELEVLRRDHTDTEDFFSEERDDPFFVKNLENVQGDERDAILLSVGYGPDEAGKVAMRFGPLNRAGGERRLNVAVTRARHAMTVVASMTAADVDLSRTGAEGAKLLKAFLDYTDRGPVALAEAITESNPRGADSPFEQEVGDELVRRGLTIQRQIGCGGYRIDIAITDPQQGGKYLLGVECDGATYHSAATARDRDRLRQAVLEGLGWRLIRVWSSDWIRDRAKQVQRILAALEAAKKPRPEPPLELEPDKAPAMRVKHPKTVEYENIEVVPDAALADAMTAALVEFGSMPAEDLIAAVSKRLGFKRTGPKIRERITEKLNALSRGGQLEVTDDGRIRLVNAP